MTPLCPVLYQRLQERFGSVLIANQGEAFQASEFTDARTGRSRVQIICTGEQYRVSCPKCGDTRHRLYINHRWAQYRHLVYCQNEKTCYASQVVRDQLYSHVFRTRRPVSAPVQRGVTGTAQTTSPRLPGAVTPLADLPGNHPALQYLADRGFDAAELSRLYRVGYCDRPDSRFPMAERRIIVPVETHGALVGWQARFVGDRNWKECAVPKYYDMPGMAKRLTLYNFDRARTFPWGVLVEGVTDVWAVGPHATALLGKSISFPQYRMLIGDFAERPLVVMLDGDAQRENEAITRDLSCRLKAGVVCVTLPRDRDPADFAPEVLADLVRHECGRQGVHLPLL